MSETPPSQPDGRLHRAQAALRQAVVAHSRGQAVDELIREAVQCMREETTRRPVTAEELSAMLRSSWDGDGDRAAAGDELRAPFGEIVRLCVREYYRQERGGA